MLSSSACFGFSEVVRIAGSLQNLSHRAHQPPHVQLVPIMTTCICGDGMQHVGQNGHIITCSMYDTMC